MLNKKKSIGIIILLSLIISIVFWCNHRVEKLSERYISSSLQKIHPAHSALLLGTSKLLSNGKKNAFFFNRIEATVSLYKARKIKYIIVSGDNSSKSYNEPLDMKKELIKAGIPSSHIFLDYAGFRTLDSVIRAYKIFGQTEFIVISQKFHNERAVFIARKNNLKAYGFNAEEVTAFNGFKTKLREYFARVKVHLDFIFGVEPKFLGDKITIPKQ